MAEGIFRNTVSRIWNAFTRKQKVLNFVDLGAGTAIRVRSLAEKHPNKNFVAVDSNPDYKERKSKLNNLKFVHSDALEYLKKKPSRSVRIINMDVFTVALPGEMPYSDMAKSAREIILDNHFISEMKRVLAPKGRFYLTLSISRSGIASEILRQAGFRVRSETLEKLESDGRISSTTERIELGKAFARKQGDTPNIVRIEARKSS